MHISAWNQNMLADIYILRKIVYLFSEIAENFWTIFSKNPLSYRVAVSEKPLRKYFRDTNYSHSIPCIDELIEVQAGQLNYEACDKEGQRLVSRRSTSENAWVVITCKTRSRWKKRELAWRVDKALSIIKREGIRGELFQDFVTL